MHRSARIGALLLLFALAAVEAVELNCDPPCDHGVCEAYLGTLSCNCHGNWSGVDCSTFICDIDDTQTCRNGGTCLPNPEDDTKFVCVCPFPYFGDVCQFTPLGNESCGDDDDDDEFDSCENGGTCYNVEGEEEDEEGVCFCSPGYWGKYCTYSRNESIPRDDCENPNFCNGHGQCIWSEHVDGGDRTSYCECEPGYPQISNCALIVDECDPSPCQNGMCRNVHVRGNRFNYTCVCDGMHSGRDCEEDFDICSDENNPCGEGDCTPILGGHYYNCTCPPGRTGYNCSSYEDPCSDLVCQNGGTCIRLGIRNENDGSYSSDEYECLCCSGFEGDQCEDDIITRCLPNPCRMEAECTLTNNSYQCDCPLNYTGVNCQFFDFCHSSPCGENAEACVNRPDVDGHTCVCKSGWGGPTCEYAIDTCQTTDNPCQHGGTCENIPGGSFRCVCPPEYTGENCSEDTNLLMVNCSSTSQSCQNGGSCVEGSEEGSMMCTCPPGFTGLQCETNVTICEIDCASLADNGRCDMECFNEVCGFDGGEGLCEDPWFNCGRPDFCRAAFKNGQCDVECNRRECLFDGHECIPGIELCPTREECNKTSDDGICQEECNTVQCPFDFEDCDSEQYAEDLLVVYILVPGREQFDQRLFLETIGEVTQTNPIIQDIEILTEKQALKEGIIVEEGNRVFQVTMRLDTEYCTQQCVETAREAVQILNALFSQNGGNIAGYPYVGSESQSSPPSGSDDKKPNIVPGVVVSTVVVVVMMVIIVGVITRKRIKARIFYPGQSQVDDHAQETTPPAKKRKNGSADHGARTFVNSSDSSSPAASATCGDYISEGSKAAKMDKGKIEWKDFTAPVDPQLGSQSEVAVTAQLGHDSRKWNYLHYHAVRNPEVMRELLEKCRSQDGVKWDLNTPGPGGYTPLMLAITQKRALLDSVSVPSRSSSSSESSSETNEQNMLISPQSKNNQLVPRSDTSSPNGSLPSSPLDCSVEALVAAQVKLDATNDFGRTALHLAAVCARGDYVKKLLAAGANPNIQDNWGQSPVHAAIGAAAEGAFHILTNFAKTDINLKSDGGTTPLMEAVKSKNLYMVKQLVKRSADLQATDYEGRTAVHWAAMVNNVEALKLLIRQGPDTIKDMQDNKGQTALFLACREGALESAKHLLDVFANATLLDNLDRSPMIIAFERQHHDVMEMLKSHGPYHYQLPTSGRHAGGVANHMQMSHHHHHHPELSLRQQRSSLVLNQGPCFRPGMMMEMQPLHPPEHLAMGHPQHHHHHHHTAELQSNPPPGQMFGDVGGYPVSSGMEMNPTASVTFNPPKPLSTPIFFSNTMLPSISTHSQSAPQSYFSPPSTSQLPPNTEHPSPHATHHDNPSPPAPTGLQNQPPHTTNNLAMSYSQQQPPSVSYQMSANHLPVTTTMSDSEQTMVNDLLTSIANDSQTPQPTSSAMPDTTTPLQHLDTLPGYPGPVVSDPYVTSQQPPQQTQQQQQQQQQQPLYSPPQEPASAGSNRSPSNIYPSPPNSDLAPPTSELVPQGNLAMAHASPPSLTPSPATGDELVRQNIAMVEGLVQQHDYSVFNNCGVDSYSCYSGIRFPQDTYSNGTTV